jgi:hypothetical protein
MSTIQEQSILNIIRTRGDWRVVIRPTTYRRNHIPNYADLLPIIAKNSVRFRGWDYPYPNVPDWDYRWDGSQTELIARPRQLAAEAAQGLFARFGLDVSLEVLRKIQERLTR